MRQLQAAAPEIEFVPEDNLVRDVRRVKSPRELECFWEGGTVWALSGPLTDDSLVRYKLTDCQIICCN
jgi:hypothetical protein